jgi:hypothetical protein
MINVSDLGFVLHVFLCQSSENPSFPGDDFLMEWVVCLNKKSVWFYKTTRFFLVFLVDALIGSL